MEIKVKRKFLGEDYTIGDLYVDGVFFCNTLEDKVRIIDDNNDGKYSTEELSTKIKHQTAIPAGYYNVILTMSNRFKKILPLLVNVPGFDGIRIHPGNYADFKSFLKTITINTNKTPFDIKENIEII